MLALANAGASIYFCIHEWIRIVVSFEKKSKSFIRGAKSLFLNIDVLIVVMYF